MKRILFLLFFVAAMVTWCTPSFASRQSVLSDAQLDAGGSTGSTDGVDMTGAVTLTVGVTGGPKLDIFGNNILLNDLLPAVRVLGANDSSMVTFKVNSSVYGDMGQTTSGVLHLITASNGTTVNFLKSVYATTLNVGTGTVNFNGGSTSTNTVAMNFTGDGTINLAANTLVTGALTTGTDNDGTLALASGSQLTGAVTGIKSINVIGGSTTAGVSATINGAVGTHSFSLLTNTLNITGGALTTATNAVVNTTLASSTVYGHVVVAAGNASNLGTGLSVNVLVPSTAYIPLGTVFNIVQSTSGTGALATVTVQNPTNPLYSFSVVTSAAAGDADIKTDAIPLTSSSLPAVAVLTIIPTTPDLLGVLAAVNAFSDPAAVNNAVMQLQPSTTSLAAPLVTFQGIREFQNLWLPRLDACSQVSWPNEDKSTCKGSDPRSGWWVKGFGYFGEQDSRYDSAGYHSSIIGTMAAYDAPINTNTRAGFGIGYARSTIKEKTFDANTSFDTYQATAYIGHDQGPWFVHGSASFGWNEYSDMRHIVFTGEDRTANARYSGQDYSAFTSTGYHFSVQKFTITPLASLQYSRVNIEGYTERDAGDVSLKVNSQHYDFLESGLGGKVERDFSYHGWSLVPELRFEWLHELSNPKLAQTAAFTAPGSSSFTTYGLKTDADMFHVGTGFTVLSCACSATVWSLETGYDYYWRNDGYTANQVTMRLTSRF